MYGLSLSELAQRASIGKATLSGLETGTRNPTLETLYAVSTQLNLPLAVLLADPDPAERPDEIHGTAALAITSPPYGASLHGQVKPTAETGQSGVQKFDYRYSTDKGNLAHVKVSELIDGFATILSGCRELLRPGGVVVITTRPWREHGELVDLPGEVIAAGVRAGLEPIERCVALLGGIRDGQFIARPSFFQLANIRKERQAGQPQAVIAHEDVIILQRPFAAATEGLWRCATDGVACVGLCKNQAPHGCECLAERNCD